MTPEQRKDLEWMRDEEREAPVSIRHAALRAALEEIDSLKARLAATSCTDCDEAEEARAKEMAELKAHLAAVVELLEQIDRAADHQIPYYAYGDNEAGCRLAGYLKDIRDLAIDALRAAEGKP